VIVVTDKGSYQIKSDDDVLLGVGTIFGAFVGKCPCSHQPRSSKRKNRGHKKLSFSSAYSRYRERNLNLDRVGSIPPGAKLGLFKIFQNNQVSSSQQLNTTGAIGGSIEAERCWDSLNPYPYVSGGPLALTKIRVPGPGAYSMSAKSVSAPGNWWQYDGKVVDNGDWGPDTLGSYSMNAPPVITGFDTAAWDKTKPRVAQANMGQFIYELRDLPGQLKTSMDSIISVWRGLGLPSRFSSNLNSHGWSVPGYYTSIDSVVNSKTLADNFLNHCFGWVPFLSDYFKFLDVFSRAHELVSDITRNNGQWQKRRAVLQSDSTERLVTRLYYPGIEPWGFQIQGLCDTRPVDGIPCKGFTDIYEVVTTDIWSKGEFTFYRPEFDMNLPENQPENLSSYLAAIQRLMTLYGVRISPGLLYAITPWSWTVDWFTGFGNYVRRLDDFTNDGIVSRGLYIMRHMKRKVVKSSTIFLSGGQRTFTWERTLEHKSRKVADSPYGFDLTWNNLSLRQYAILGAIGITRSNSGFVSRGA
jgi:hypothetical protein